MANRAAETRTLHTQILSTIADIRSRVNRAGSLLTSARQKAIESQMQKLVALANGLVKTTNGEERAESVLSKNLTELRTISASVLEYGAIVDSLVAAAKRRAKGSWVDVTVARRPGELVAALGRGLPGFKFSAPDFGPVNGFEVRRPRLARTKIANYKASIGDLSVDSNGVIHISEWEVVVDYCPSFLLMDYAAQHGVYDDDKLVAPELVIETGALDAPDIGHNIIDNGVIDAKGRKWLIAEVSGAGMRQGKLILWPEELAPLSRKFLMGSWEDVWMGKQMIPAKAVNYLALGRSSLIDYALGAEIFADANIRVIPDLSVLHQGVSAKKKGRVLEPVDHKADVTDGAIAVGSAVMRRIEQVLGYPPYSLHALQIRGDLGTGIKGLLVEYTEIDPNTVLVYESATKISKKTDVVARMLTEGRLGIVRVNRMPDNLTGITSLSKQVLGLLRRGTLDSLNVAKEIAKGIAENSLSPDVIQAIVGLIDGENNAEDAIENAAKDGSVKKAVLASNPSLALQDRSVRRYVGDMLVDRVKRQALFGNLMTAGYDLWQAPDPLAVKIGELGLVKGPVTLAELQRLAKKVGLPYRQPDEVAWAGAPEHLDGKEAALLRHPMQHPAQLATSKVIKLKRDHRWGLVFLPASGMHQAIMGGSDFDGDEIKVVIDERVVQAVIATRGMMDYIILPPEGSKDDDKQKLSEETYPEMLREVLHRAMRAVGQIGILSNLASIVSALTTDANQRELLLSVLSFLVMVAVDAVKTGVFPTPSDHLTEFELVGSPLEFNQDGDLRARSHQEGEIVIKQRPVWLGQPSFLRKQFAEIDGTEMAEIYMGMDELVKLMAPAKKDSNDRKVAQQLMRVARSIMPEPNDLRELATQIVAFLPEEKRKEILDRLEILRLKRNEAQWSQKRDEVISINAQMADAKWALADIMKVPTMKARKLMAALGQERARAIAAVIYDIRPSAAWSFCGPELVDLFGRAAGRPAMLMDQVVQPASIKVMGLGFNVGKHYQDIQEVPRFIKEAGTVSLRQVEYNGAMVTRVFVGDHEVGQVSAEFEPYAASLINMDQVPVDPAHCSMDKKTLVLRLVPPFVGDPNDVWLEAAILRIKAAWIPSVLESARKRLLEEYKLLTNPPEHIAAKLREAIALQRAAASHAALIDGARDLDALQKAAEQIRASGLPDEAKDVLRARFEGAQEDIRLYPGGDEVTYVDPLAGEYEFSDMGAPEMPDFN